jgi:hypothetical protein
LIIELAKYSKDSSGKRFKEFGCDMVLKEVYIGCESELNFDDITSSYDSGDKSVIVKITRPSFRDFRIVWDQSKKSVRT